MPHDPQNRREFLTLLGASAAATAWPHAAPAQQAGMPVVGFLYAGAPEVSASRIAAFRKGLSEVGLVEGQNVAVEYRWAYGDFDRLPELAADLVRHRVAVIAAIGSAPPAFAAKAATTTIPIVFAFGGDQVQLGLVASFNRPGGNVTGLSMVNMELAPKLLGLLHELLPGATRFGVLVNPSNATGAEIVTRDTQTAAAAIVRQVEVLPARTNQEIDAVFASLVQKRIDGLLVAPDVLFNDRRVQLVTLATRHGVPAIYSNRDYAEIGGLMTYGTNIADQYRQAAVYVGRIIRGEKPADLPVVRPTKFEFIINLQTAKTLALAIPPGLLAIADEVIE